MSYEVTANRRRPKDFDSLSGQEFVVSTLKNSIDSERIAHAYLFSGPRGVGKTSAARILAKALNCETGPTASPCGTCSSCMEIAKGNALDVIEIDGASNTSVNDVREIKDEVLFAPNNSRYKVYIIDEVHMLSNSAFNALLKTIEEPPPYIVFVFATTEVHKVPATIRSRCQQYHFRLFDLETIKRLLMETCVELGISIEDDALLWIAREATGSMRDAYTLFDQVVSFSDEEIKLSVIREKLGLVGLERLNELADYCAAKDVSSVLSLVASILETGVSVEQFVIDMADYFRNILFLKENITKESIIGFSPARYSGKILEALSVAQIRYALDTLLETYRNIRYSLNQRFDLELALARIARASEYIDPEEIWHKIESIKNNFSFGVSTPKQVDKIAEKPEPLETSHGQSITDEQPVSSAHINGELTEDVWQVVIQDLRQQKLTLATALEKAVRHELMQDQLLLVFESPGPISFVREGISLISQVLQKHIGRNVKIEILLEKPDAPAETEEPEKISGNVDLVKKVFRGQVVQGE